MGFCTRRKYNAYRHRYYNVSKSKARKYAASMNELSNYFDNSDWDISAPLDSCYKNFGNYEIRISNHSAEYVHDLSGKTGLLVNIKGSKLDFIDIINNKVPIVIKFLNKLPLNKYRFINIFYNNVNCYYKGFKTKKDIFQIKF